jgi:hypothetical protein
MVLLALTPGSSVLILLNVVFLLLCAPAPVPAGAVLHLARRHARLSAPYPPRRSLDLAAAGSSWTRCLLFNT